MCILEDESKLVPSSIWQHKNNGKNYKLETANVQIQENKLKEPKKQGRFQKKLQEVMEQAEAQKALDKKKK